MIGLFYKLKHPLSKLLRDSFRMSYRLLKTPIWLLFVLVTLCYQAFYITSAWFKLNLISSHASVLSLDVLLVIQFLVLIGLWALGFSATARYVAGEALSLLNVWRIYWVKLLTFYAHVLFIIVIVALVWIGFHVLAAHYQHHFKGIKNISLVIIMISSSFTFAVLISTLMAPIVGLLTDNSFFSSMSLSYFMVIEAGKGIFMATLPIILWFYINSSHTLHAIWLKQHHLFILTSFISTVVLLGFNWSFSSLFVNVLVEEDIL